MLDKITSDYSEREVISSKCPRSRRDKISGAEKEVCVCEIQLKSSRKLWDLAFGLTSGRAPGHMDLKKV